jgi:predicted dithiol-disulfide oxidoreductase (DUF899 family)
MTFASPGRPTSTGSHATSPRHVDFMWPLYAALDRTPGGRGDFEPSLSYD